MPVDHPFEEQLLQECSGTLRGSAFRSIPPSTKVNLVVGGHLNCIRNGRKWMRATPAPIRRKAAQYSGRQSGHGSHVTVADGRSEPVRQSPRTQWPPRVAVWGSIRKASGRYPIGDRTGQSRESRPVGIASDARHRAIGEDLHQFSGTARFKIDLLKTGIEETLQAVVEKVVALIGAPGHSRVRRRLGNRPCAPVRETRSE